MNRPEIYAFYSVKGGAGKSALSIAAALGFAERQRPVAVLDLDLMGTSIADGLALEAPDLLRPDGSLAWTGPRTRELTRSQTLERRNRHSARTPTLPYLDSLLLDATIDFDAGSMAWKHPDQPTIRWYPSSPRLVDSTRAAQQLLIDPDTALLADRITDLVQRVSTPLGPQPVVLIDLPPGLYGLPKLVSDALATSDQIAAFVPVLVTTPDRNDLLRSIDVFLELSRTLYEMRWVLNRNLRAASEVRAEVRNALSPHWHASGIAEQLEAVGWSGEGLGQLYQQDELALPSSVTSRVVELLTRVAS